jgi:hypothetical protein
MNVRTKLVASLKAGRWCHGFGIVAPAQGNVLYAGAAVCDQYSVSTCVRASHGTPFTCNCSIGLYCSLLSRESCPQPSSKGMTGCFVWCPTHPYFHAWPLLTSERLLNTLVNFQTSKRECTRKAPGRLFSFRKQASAESSYRLKPVSPKSGL